jgi:release factor glutamine methyltransferase
MTIREALIHGAALLKAAGIPTPTLDASLLLGDILNMGKVRLILAGPEPLDDGSYQKFERSLERRCAGECAAYILGRKEFHGLDFTVSADVLVPRPDTETLADAALSRIDELSHEALPSPLSLLDLCTGSGALAVSLKHERPALQVWASDISGKALALARENANRLLKDEEPPIRFIESDLFDRIEKASGPAPANPPPFDLIVSNPPYIPTALIAALSPEVRGEPRIALDGGEDGLDLIRRIVADAPGFLNPGGTLLLEADPAQMTAVSHLLEERGYSDIQTYKDLTGEPRVIGGKSPR